MTAPLRLEIASAADVGAATAAIHALVYGAEAADRPVEVVITAARLDGTVLQIGSDMDPRQLDIAVRGAPTRMRAGTLAVTGRQVEVSGIVIEGGREDGYALQVQATRSLTLRDVDIFDLEAQDQRAGSQTERGVSLQALEKDVTAEIVGGRFVGSSFSPVLAFGEQPGGGFASIELIGGRFGDNHAPEVSVSNAARVTATDCLRMGAGGFLHASSPQTLVLGDPREIPRDETLLKTWR